MTGTLRFRNVSVVVPFDGTTTDVSDPLAKSQEVIHAPCTPYTDSARYRHFAYGNVLGSRGKRKAKSCAPGLRFLRWPEHDLARERLRRLGHNHSYRVRNVGGLQHLFSTLSGVGAEFCVH